VDRHIARVEVAGPVHANSRAVPPVRGNGHVNPGHPPAPDLEKLRRRQVTQHRPFAGGQDRRHPQPALGQACVSDGVHASVLPVEPPGGHALCHGAARESGLDELSGRDQPVLPGGQAGQLRIEGRGCVTFVSSWATFVNHPPIMPPRAFQITP
jgi:hypothetical protein